MTSPDRWPVLFRQRGYREPVKDPSEVEAIEAEQQQMIEAYLVDLWTPQPPMFGPDPLPMIEKPHADSRWLRNLNHAELRELPYADVLEAIRAA